MNLTICRACASSPAIRSALSVTAAILVLSGCSTPGKPSPPPPEPAVVRAQIVELMPDGIPDREGWAHDIFSTFAGLDLPPTKENICAVLAVTIQESTFQVAPPVPGLAKISREEIYRRAARLRIPEFLIDAALRLESPNGESYSERLNSVEDEKELSAIFEDFLGTVPLGQQLFGSFNPVRTGGPMQVSIDFAESLADDYPYAVDGSIRNEVFSRRGGMYFGIAHLLDYPANYSQPLYRFADFNAGWYASRNAAFQRAVTEASGITLALDGDLIIHGSRTAGSTELAVRTLAEQLDLNDGAIRQALDSGDTLAFEETRLYQRTFALADRLAGESLPRAVLPGITLESPKITRQLTTAWFANRVNDRHRRCMTGGL
ncbi:MAG TPA: DUF1615 domain-containing protein [Pseudomonas xinjiangensis]|uniref:DUF1615 domain-containing protein n=2 Tax=root TaxID=1 RepID=A0A7V1BR70_9GAMM|nr:DUF1615 domain-containing protein [Halopseudomonas xinjiangensis]HEC47450.1 DUF1615 domain-containing protein [Halopseudomonas xinjiangensis]